MSKPHAAAVRAVEAYHETAGELPMEKAISDEYQPLVDACLQEHGGKNYEPECPICEALRLAVGGEDASLR